MSLHLLDTNVWIALAHGEVAVVAHLRRLPLSEVVSCSIIRAELAFGARKSRRVAENLEGFQQLLAPYASLPFDDISADHYGMIRAALERGGTPIGANDLLIASVALAHNCILVTRNSREFRRVAGLRIEEWR